MEAKFSRSTPKVRALAKREASQHQSWDQIFTRSATKTRTTESARQKFAQTARETAQAKLSQAKNGCPKSWSRCPEEGIGESQKAPGEVPPIKVQIERILEFSLRSERRLAELGAERAAEARFTERAKRQLERLEAAPQEVVVTSVPPGRRTDPPPRIRCRAARWNVPCRGSPNQCLRTGSSFGNVCAGSKQSWCWS